MSNEVHLIVGAATDVGRVRTVNEDSHGFLRCAAGDLLVVCDGMGGHAAGDLASRTALDAITLTVAHTGATLPPTQLLERAALQAHENVRAVADTSQANAGMGTTCVMALVKDGMAWICNVGDSRCYLVRGGQIRQVTVDHTKAQKLFDAGIISAEQFANHPEKGVLAQAIGQRNPPQPSVSGPHALQVDDYLVLCSDGVYDSTEVDMASLTSGANPNYAAHDLVATAVQRDGKDNATVVVGRYVNLDKPVFAVAPVSGAAATATAEGHKARGQWGNPMVFGALALVLLVGLGLGWWLKPAGLGDKPVSQEPVVDSENHGNEPEPAPAADPPSKEAVKAEPQANEEPTDDPSPPNGEQQVDVPKAKQTAKDALDESEKAVKKAKDLLKKVTDKQSATGKAVDAAVKIADEAMTEAKKAVEMAKRLDEASNKAASLDKLNGQVVEVNKLLSKASAALEEAKTALKTADVPSRNRGRSVTPTTAVGKDNAAVGQGATTPTVTTPGAEKDVKKTDASTEEQNTDPPK